MLCSSTFVFRPQLINSSNQTYGQFADLSNSHPQVFAYLRTLGDVHALVLLNFKETDTTFVVEAERLDGYRLVLSNYENLDADIASNSGVFGKEGKIALRGYEGRVYLRN